MQKLRSEVCVEFNAPFYVFEIQLERLEYDLGPGACLSMLRPHRETLNQFRPSVPVWSEPLWPTFVTHVGISAQLILRIFTSYSYDEFGQLEKSIDYTLSSGKLNGLRKKSPRLPIPDINFKIAVTQFTKVYNQQYPH